MIYLCDFLDFLFFTSRVHDALVLLMSLYCLTRFFFLFFFVAFNLNEKHKELEKKRNRILCVLDEGRNGISNEQIKDD